MIAAKNRYLGCNVQLVRRVASTRDQQGHVRREERASGCVGDRRIRRCIDATQWIVDEGTSARARARAANSTLTRIGERLVLQRGSPTRFSTCCPIGSDRRDWTIPRGRRGASGMKSRATALVRSTLIARESSSPARRIRLEPGCCVVRRERYRPLALVNATIVA